MEESLRRSQQGIAKPLMRSESSLMHERRPLKSVALAPPDYKAPQNMLVDTYIEKDIRFAGTVNSIPVHLDCTNRTDVLRIIDRGKREKCLPSDKPLGSDCIISLSVQNIKISKRDGNEELLLRLPINEIAAICYIRDEDQHILAIKFGNFKLSRGLTPEEIQDMCQLVVLNCDTKASAEEVCSLVSQCFQLVYTDATMHFLDTKLSEVSAGLSIGSSTLKSDKSSANSTPKKERHYMPSHTRPGFFTGSSQELNQVNGTVSSSTSRSLPRGMTRRSSTARSESELSSTASELIHDYMSKLYTKLNTDELRKFALLVKAWHSNLPFLDFCQKVLELYGADRKYLLIGMKPFIPDKDTANFETFLEGIGLGSGGTGTGIYSDTISSSKIGRTISGGASGNGDEFDQMLNVISHNIETLATSAEVPKTT